MKDSELQNLLRQLKVPVANESNTARALDRALVALRNTPGKEQRPGWAVWMFATAAATVCVVLALAWNGQRDDSRVFAEIERLFPGQLLAVIQNGGKTDLCLSALPGKELSPDQRVRITVRSGGETAEILTYSGQEVCVPLKSGSLCLTPLVTGEGDVLVLSEEDAFARSGRIRSATIRATSLTKS